jgi:hypothetical protein
VSRHYLAPLHSTALHLLHAWCVVCAPSSEHQMAKCQSHRDQGCAPRSICDFRCHFTQQRRFANPCSVCVRMRLYLIRLRLHFTPCDRTCVKTALTARIKTLAVNVILTLNYLVEFCSRIREAPLYIHHARPTHTCKCTPEAIRHPAHFSKRIYRAKN